MAKNRSAENESTALKCPKCGNHSRFIEVMENVENLVDGDGNHLHQVNGDAAYYLCVKCGTKFAENE